MKKVAVLTGASGALGGTIIEKFLKDDWYVFACARNPSPELLERLGPNGAMVSVDFESDSSVRRCAEEILEKTKVINALVNCAGVASGGMFGFTKINELKKVFEVNFFSQILFSQLLSRRMIAAREGSIVNITSIAGILADSGTMSYGCSKAALGHATRIMASELGAFNIRVNAVAPTVLNSGMGNMMDNVAKAKLVAKSSLPGALEALDVAELVSFLCSDQSSSISGQIIRLDRGITS